MPFQKFSKAIRVKFDTMAKHELLSVAATKNELWDIYLRSFPEGTDPIYKTETTHNCVCCKHFIRDIGDAVTLKNGVVDSIWNVPNLEYPYDVVAAHMHRAVSDMFIENIFLSTESDLGAAKTVQQTEAGSINWHHFNASVPSRFVSSTIAETRGSIKSAMAVFKRGLEELTVGALDEVGGLISDNQVYRAEEHASAVREFTALHRKYSTLNSEMARNRFMWENYSKPVIRFRNTVIGTLVDDLSTGVDLIKAVKSFESKVAPQNYKRSKSLITKRMVEDAMKTVETLGIRDSLVRRHAEISDISINNVLWADRDTSHKMRDSLTDMLLDEVTPAKSIVASEMPIDDFIKNVLADTSNLEILVDNDKVNNMMSLVAPEHPDSPNILQWDNNFTWSYNNNVTDSIKAKVAKAGGNVTGIIRSSLAWYNTDDLDIHVTEPNGNLIYYRNKCSKLDVDMNASSTCRDPVENVTWQRADYGTYQVFVNQYAKREHIDVGFVVEVEFAGNITTLSYAKPVIGKIHVCDMVYSKNGLEVKPTKHVVHGQQSREEWGIKTGKFAKVNAMMLSPNHWDGNAVGNKHFFFTLDKCKNPETVRGLYNEYLTGSLAKHRKVFEIIGDKTKCPVADDQLSGLGFSSTNHDDVIVRADGRTIKVKF